MRRFTCLSQRRDIFIAIISLLVGIVVGSLLSPARGGIAIGRNNHIVLGWKNHRQIR